MVRETRHLWVGNLPENIREERIREHFKRYGRVQSIKLLPRCTEEKTGEITMACTVAFMDIKSASKAHNAELKIDDRTLNTEYYEPAAIPSATASPQNNSSPYSTSPGSTRFPNGHGSTDDHGSSSFPDRFYERSTSSRLAAPSGGGGTSGVGGNESTEFTGGGRGGSNRASSATTTTSATSAYHGEAASVGGGRSSSSTSSTAPSGNTTTGGRSRDRTGGNYRNGPYGSSSSNVPTNASSLENRHSSRVSGNSWQYEPSSRYSSSTGGSSCQLDTGYSTTVTTSESTERRNTDQSSKKKTKSRSGSRAGSRSPSPSGSTSSRSPSRSRSRSSSSSSSSSLSRDTSSTGSPKSKRVTSSNTSNSNHQPVVHSDDRRPLAICVKNLPVRSSDTSLKDGLFHEYKKHGKVTWVKVVGKDAERHAIVCFKKPEDVEKALEVSRDKLFFGCKIEVAPYQGYDVDDNDLRPYEAEIDEYHPKATRTLFIGNLEKDVTATDLRKHFDQFGDIIEIDIKKQGAVSSYAFCQYSDIVSVVKAIRKMDGEHLGSNRIKLGFGKSMPYNCVWIDGINESVNEKYLKIQFEPFGVINKLHIDREKGQALIFYEQVMSAQTAVTKMRGFTLKNTKIQVDFASRECQESFYERLEKQGTILERPIYEDRRESTVRTFDASSTRFARYETPTRPRTSSYSSRSSASLNQVAALQSPGTPGSVTPRGGSSRTRPRFSDYYDQTLDYADRHFRSYDEYSQSSTASHDDLYEHEYNFGHEAGEPLPGMDNVVTFAPPDMRNLQKERVHLLEQLEECPSSGDELIAPKKRKLDLMEAVITNEVIIEANRDHRKVMEVRRLSDVNMKHHSRRPSIDSGKHLRHEVIYVPHSVCKRRKTAGSDSGSRVHHYDHSGPESIGGSRPGTPLCDERPENLQPSEPRRVPREREGPLTLPLPKFAAQLMNRGSVSVAGIKGQKDSILSSPPPAVTSPRISNPRPPSPVHAPPPASPPPRPPSLSSNSSDSDIPPPSPSLEERIKSLDEKYEKWSGSRALSAAGGDALALLDANLEKFRKRHKILDLDLKEVQPSEIVKSVMAKRSVFDEDLKRLENVGEKYEPKEFLFFPRTVTTTVPTTSLSTPPVLKLATVTSVSKTPTLLSPRSTGTGIQAAKGLQYPFPTHPPILMSPSVVVSSHSQTTSTVTTSATTTATSAAVSLTPAIMITTATSTVLTSTVTRGASHGDNRLKPCPSAPSDTRTSSKMNVNKTNAVSSVTSVKCSEKTVVNIPNVNAKISSRRDSSSSGNSPRADVKSRRNSDTSARRSDDSEVDKDRDQSEDRKRERLEKVKAENEKLEKEKSERERLEREKHEHERQEKLRIEKERIEREFELERQRLEKERLEKEKLEKEQQEKERAEKERLRIERENLEKERLEKQRLEHERHERERERREKEEEKHMREERERLEKEREKKEKEEYERKHRDDRHRKEDDDREKHDREQKHDREKERTKHKDDNHDRRRDDHKHHHNDNKHVENHIDNKHTKESRDEKLGSKDVNQINSVDSHESRSSYEKSKSHADRDSERRKESVKENRDNNVHDKHKNDNKIRELTETRHMSIDLDSQKSSHEKHDPSKRKERNNSLPANIGSKRRFSSHETSDVSEELKKRKISHDNKNLSERRDSKDSTRSEDRSKSNKHKNNVNKSHDKYNSSKDCEERRKEREERHKRHKLEKQKSKSKSREKETQEKEINEHITPLTDKEFLSHLELKSTDDVDKHKKERDSKEKRMPSEDRDKIKKERPSIDKSQILADKISKCRLDTDSGTRSGEEKKKRERIRKLTNSSDSDSDEPKKHSIFDIVDDEPAYISMYDKVKARSCKNMAKLEEEKRQEKLKAKFTQLKQSRAKREEKKRSTSWDEDSDSDKEHGDIKIKRCPKILISSDDESQDVKSRKKKEIYSDSDSSAIFKSIKQEIIDTSDDESRNKSIILKSLKSRITSDTSDDERNKKKIEPQIKSEFFTEGNSNEMQIYNADNSHDNTHMFKIKDEVKVKKERRNSKHQDNEIISVFSDVSQPDPKPEKFNNKREIIDITSDEEVHENVKKERSERREKKHKKKQKKQKHLMSSEESAKFETISDSVPSENPEKIKHEKKKDHSKKEKRRDKNKEGREKSKKSKKNKLEHKSDSKREGKMENIFGSLSEDSEHGTKDIKQEVNVSTFNEETMQHQPTYQKESEKDTDIKQKEKSDREREKEEHKRKKEKKRREKERRLQEAAAALANAGQVSNENSMDFADMGKQLEANMLQDDDTSIVNKLTENRDDSFNFITDTTEFKKDKEEKREGREKKKKRKKSKDEKSKHHNHHHHDKNKTKTSEIKKEPTPESRADTVITQPQNQSLPNILEEIITVKKEDVTPTDFSASPIKPMISPLPKTPSQDKKLEKLIPAFSSEVDEKIHETAVKSISEFETLIKKEEPIVKEDDNVKSSPLPDEKPRVVISQEETEDAVAALLGESFGVDQQEEFYTDNNSIEEPTTSLVEEANAQDDEEMRQAVQSLSNNDLDIKPDTPQSEHDLQIDTDTEEQEDTPLRFDSASKSPEIVEFSQRPKTPENIQPYFASNIVEKQTSIPSLKTTTSIGSPPSLTPIRPTNIHEVRKTIEKDKIVPASDQQQTMISQSWSDNKPDTTISKSQPSVIKLETKKSITSIPDPDPIPLTSISSRPFVSPPVLQVTDPQYPPLQPLSKPEHTALAPISCDTSKVPIVPIVTAIPIIPSIPLIQTTGKTPIPPQLHNLPARSPVQINKPPSETGLLSPRLASNLIHNRMPITPVMVSKPMQPTTVILQQSKIAHTLEPPKLVSTSDPRSQDRARMVFQTSNMPSQQFANFNVNQPRMMIQGNIRHLPPQGLLVPARHQFNYLTHSAYNLPSIPHEKQTENNIEKISQPLPLSAPHTPLPLNVSHSPLPHLSIPKEVITTKPQIPTLPISKPLTISPSPSPFSPIYVNPQMKHSPNPKPLSAAMSPKPPVQAVSPKPVQSLSPKLVQALSPRPVISVSPRPTSASSPRPTSAASPRPTPAASPRPTPAASPRPISTPSPRPPTTLSPRPPTTLSPRPPTTLSPRPSTTPSPRPMATSSPRPTSAASPRPAHVASPKSMLVASPKPVAEVVPRLASEITPKTAAEAIPKSVAEPNSRAINEATQMSLSAASPSPVTSNIPKPVTSTPVKESYNSSVIQHNVLIMDLPKITPSISEANKVLTPETNAEENTKIKAELEESEKPLKLAIEAVTEELNMSLEKASPEIKDEKPLELVDFKPITNEETSVKVKEEAEQEIPDEKQEIDTDKQISSVIKNIEKIDDKTETNAINKQIPSFGHIEEIFKKEDEKEWLDKYKEAVDNFENKTLLSDKSTDEATDNDKSECTSEEPTPEEKSSSDDKNVISDIKLEGIQEIKNDDSEILDDSMELEIAEEETKEPPTLRSSSRRGGRGRGRGKHQMQKTPSSERSGIVSVISNKGTKKTFTLNRYGNDEDPINKEQQENWFPKPKEVDMAYAVKSPFSHKLSDENNSENAKTDDSKISEEKSTINDTDQLDLPDKKLEETQDAKTDESDILDESIESETIEEETKDPPILRSSSRRGGRGRGRGKSQPVKPVAASERGGIQTRRGKLKELSQPNPPAAKRGRGGKTRNERKLSKSESDTVPADIYEFRDEPDDTNKEQRPRLILTIKSPAISNSNISQTTATVKEVTKDGAKEIGKEHTKETHSLPVSKVENKEDFAPPSTTNTRKSRRLQERDTSKSSVDDTIEDVIKNTVHTRATSNQRRSGRQANPIQSPPQPDTPRKSPRGRKARRASEATETSSSEETPKEEIKAVPQMNFEEKPAENAKEPEKSLEKPTELLSKEKPLEGLKATVLRRIKGDLNQNSNEPTNLIDPVTGELIPMRESEEGKYIPLPGTNNVPEVKKPGSLPAKEPAASVNVPVVTEAEKQKSTEASIPQSTVITQPQQINIIQQSKPQSLKAHVLSSQVTQAIISLSSPLVTQNKVPTSSIVGDSNSTETIVSKAAPVQKPISSMVITKSITPIVTSKTVTPVVVTKPVTPISQNLSVNTNPSNRLNVLINVGSKPIAKQIIKTPVLSPVHMTPQQKQQQIQMLQAGKQAQVKPHVSTTMVNQGQIVNNQMVHMKHPPIIKQQVMLGKGPIVKSLHSQQILTGAVPSPPLSKSQLPMSNAGRIIQTPSQVGDKGIMDPPKIDVSMSNVLMGQRPKLSPQGTQQRVGQTGLPLPAFEPNLGDSMAHFPPGPLRPIPDISSQHYMHSQLMQYQQFLRQQQLQHFSRTGSLEKVGQEGEEAPVTSPPLELRRARGTSVPHSLHSPHDRTTDSPQIGQVYNVHTSARMPYPHSSRYYEPAEPPPAHRPLTSHSSLAALSSDRALAHMTPDRPLSGHSTLSSHVGGLVPSERVMPAHMDRQMSTHGMMSAGLGAGGNLLGSVARHIGADTPTSQRGLQAATPPHASQVPREADSLVGMVTICPQLGILRNYTRMWQGQLALKTDQAAVQMYYISGNESVARATLPQNADGTTPPLRIFQRMRLEPTQVEGVVRKMQMAKEHCMLLALPCGNDHNDVVQQCKNLCNGFINYLQQKQAAGIVNVAAPGTTQPAAYVVHIFPYCDFVNEHLGRLAPNVLDKVKDLAHLLIVITTV